jgi:hypothetical protein
LLPPLPSKPLIDLTETDLLRLVEDEVREDVEIDYKIKFESDCQEFVRDVSSFANTKGGYLVYGMDEENELPTRLVALEGFDSGKAIGRLNSWAQEHIRPRPTLRFKPVSLGGGGEALVVEVPRSWIGPHEVRQEHRFYHRTQHGKAPMDVDQLRMAFNQERDFLEAAATFHTHRVEHWKGRSAGLGDTHALFVLHFLPADGLLGRRRVNLTGRSFGGRPVPSPNGVEVGQHHVWEGGVTSSFNLEGYAFHENLGSVGEARSCQVFRNGGVEHNWVVRREGESKRILPVLLDDWMDNASRHAALVMNSNEVQGPVALAGSLIGAAGWIWTLPDRIMGNRLISEGHLRLPEVLLGSADDPPGPAVEEVSRYLWNAMGIEKSPFFKDGVFSDRG